MTPQSPAPVAGRPLTAEADPIEPCGGCGETNPSRRCLGCLHDFVSRPASDQPVEAIGAGREEKVARIIHKREFGGRETWGQATPAYRSHCLATAADIIAALSPASPARSPMGEPVAWIERQNDGTRYGEPKRWPPSDRARSYAQEMGRTIEPLYAAASPARPELTVWYGKMPESNGRENWTAVLRRVNPTDKWDQGFCFARSEYPGRVLYEADRVRWIIGERAERPDILAYDEDAHSGYVEPASPARTPMGGPQVLKGVGKINGDGWKDTTTIGEVVYVWNAEKPSPYAPGQYPRIDNEGWSASTAQYDFSPASVDEVRALAAPTPMGGDREHSSRCWGRTSFSDEVLHCYCQTAPTPMGGEVEALREAVRLALEDADALERIAEEADDNQWPDWSATMRQAALRIKTLAAASPSPAQGGAFDTLEEWEHDDQRELSRLYRHRFDDSLQFNRSQMRTAIRHGRRLQALSASPQPEAGEASEDDRAQAWLLRHYRQKAEQAGFGSLAEMMHAAAPPSVQPVEGK